MGMGRSFTLRAVAAVAFLAASGCSRDTDFDLKHTFHVHPTPPGLTYDATQTLDLASQAGAAWDHRDRLKSVRVVGAKAVASNVVPASGTTGSGSASLIPPGGAPIPIGTWTDVPIVAGSLVEVAGSDALNAALNDALEGSGQLSFQLAGSASQEFEADIEVTLHVTVEYSISPF
jgi:hypothetical protein